jgi:hypothetical protein
MCNLIRIVNIYYLYNKILKNKKGRDTMKKSLVKNENSTCYYFKTGEKVIGIHENLRGDASKIYGDTSKIYGDVSNIRGDVSKIYGDVSKIYGDVSNISGNVIDISGDVTNILGDVTDISGDLDKCVITEEERRNGINIKDLIK